MKTVSGKSGYRRWVLLLALPVISYAVTMPEPVYGEENSAGKILAVNSNSRVKAYSQVLASFKEAMNTSLQEIDLDGKKEPGSSLTYAVEKGNPDLVYCIGSAAYVAVNSLHPEGNVIFSSAINWRRLPGADKSYGVSNELSTEMQITMFRYFFPEVKRIGVIYSKSFNREWIKSARESAGQLGVKIVAVDVKDAGDVTSALEKLLPKIDALWITPDPIVLASGETIQKIFLLSDKVKKPVFAYRNVFAKFGAVLTLSADLVTVGRQVAGLARQLLAGAGPAEKVENPAGTYITLNLKKVTEYGIPVNMEAMDSVNHVIE